MKLIKHKLIKIVAIIIAVIICLLFTWIALNPLKILKVTPSDKETSVDLNQPITIALNKSINLGKLTVTSNPSLDFNVTNIGNSQISLTPKLSYLQNTFYTVVFHYNQNVLGAVSFTTNKAQSDPQFLERVAAQMVVDYPLAADMPYTKTGYRAYYIGPRILTIEIYDPKIPQDNVLTEIKKWVSSRSVDPASHEYKFVNMAHPSPTTIR